MSSTSAADVVEAIKSHQTIGSAGQQKLGMPPRNCLALKRGQLKRNCGWTRTNCPAPVSTGWMSSTSAADVVEAIKSQQTSGSVRQQNHQCGSAVAWV